MIVKEKTSAVKRATPLYISAFVLVALAIGLIVFITHSKNSDVADQLMARSKEVDAGPHVRTSTVLHSSAESSIQLEGDALPYASTILYAKIGGYLKDIKVDKGDHVKAGQVLAIIQSPETDRQFL